MALRDELDIPIPAMAPSYRPTGNRREMMDPATKRLAIFAIIIGAALLGLVAAWGVTSRHRGGVPVVDAPAGPVRVKPADPGGMKVSNAGESILNGDADAKQTLAPAPETPAPQGLKAEERAAANASGAVAQAPSSATPPAEAPSEAPLPRPSIGGRAPEQPAASGGAARSAQPSRLTPGEPPPPRPNARALAGLAPGAAVLAANGAARAADGPNMNTVPDLNTPMPHTAMPDTKMPVTPMPVTKMPITTLPDNSYKSTPMPPPDITLPAPSGDAAAGVSAMTPVAPMTPAAPAAPTPVQPAAIERQAPVAHGKRPVVQFASLMSGPEALAEWHRLVKLYPDLLGEHTPTITKFPHDGKVYWRVRTSGFPSLSDAVVFCQKVKSRGGQCIATF